MNMKRMPIYLAALLLVLAPAIVKTALAAPSTASVTTALSTQALSASAPSGAQVTGALDLTGVTGYRLTVCAASGNTLTGGSLDAYSWIPRLSMWARAPVLDLAITPTAQQCESFGDQETFVARGQVYYASDTVTESGSGTTTMVLLEGSQR